MIRRIHRGDGIHNRTVEEQEIFRKLLVEELVEKFGLRIPFCCITESFIY